LGGPHQPGGGGSEYRVERVGVLGGPVCDQELQAAGPLGLIYERVPGLLGCLGGGGVGSDAGEVDPATVMLDDEQHLKPAEKDGARHGRRPAAAIVLASGGQELLPASSCALRRGVDPG
jgi:hypothetical protein